MRSEMRFEDGFEVLGVTQRPYIANPVELTRRLGVIRRLDYVEVLAVRRGEGRQVIETPSGRVVRRMSPGQMFLLRPSDEIGFQARDAHGMSIIAVSFPRGDWETFAGFVGLDPSWSTAELPPFAALDPDGTEFRGPFDVALRRFREGPTRVDLLRFLLEVIPRIVAVTAPRLPGFGAPGWLHESVDAMHDEANLRLGVARLLELTHVSGQYLAASVRRYFGVTPTALVTDLRLRHAARLLADTDASVGEIAARCGYTTLSHFSNTFRTGYNLSPREYRARQRDASVAI